ncbi:MAG: hypothetical protein PHS17_16155 [Desulfobacterales bacterium]|nr:hypothetical protein [Desulfobacterales bacterium]
MKTIPTERTGSGSSRDQVQAHEAQVKAQGAQGELTTVEKSILKACRDAPKTGRELVAVSGYATRTGNFKRSLEKLLVVGFIEMTIPGKPRSSKQKYRLTPAGEKTLKALRKEGTD